jgi:hypothetical protein
MREAVQPVVAPSHGQTVEVEGPVSSIRDLDQTLEDKVAVERVLMRTWVVSEVS